MKKAILILLLIVVVALQFVPMPVNKTAEAQPNHISNYYRTPESVEHILQAACYDCHSNNTQYPWYSKIQPFGLVLSNHIKKGKKKLNFDEFYTYTLERQAHKMEEVAEVVKEGEMPLKPYSVLHGDAKLTELQKQKLIDWAESVRLNIQN